MSWRPRRLDEAERLGARSVPVLPRAMTSVRAYIGHVVKFRGLDERPGVLSPDTNERLDGCS